MEVPTDDPVTWCTGCGLPTGRCDGTCRRPLDPPRFCARCGRRVAVLVHPTGYRVRCRRCDTVATG